MIADEAKLVKVITPLSRAFNTGPGVAATASNNAADDDDDGDVGDGGDDDDVGGAAAAAAAATASAGAPAKRRRIAASSARAPRPASDRLPAVTQSVVDERPLAAAAHATAIEAEQPPPAKCPNDGKSLSLRLLESR